MLWRRPVAANAATAVAIAAAPAVFLGAPAFLVSVRRLLLLLLLFLSVLILILVLVVLVLVPLVLVVVRLSLVASAAGVRLFRVVHRKHWMDGRIMDGMRHHLRHRVIEGLALRIVHLMFGNLNRLFTPEEAGRTEAERAR